MPYKELALIHPRRAGVGEALSRMIPLPEPDTQTRLEEHRLRALDRKDEGR